MKTALAKDKIVSIQLITKSKVFCTYYQERKKAVKFLGITIHKEITEGFYQRPFFSRNSYTKVADISKYRVYGKILYYKPSIKISMLDENSFHINFETIEDADQFLIDNSIMGYLIIDNK